MIIIGFNIAPNIVKYPDILSGSIDDPDIGNNKMQINAVFLEVFYRDDLYSDEVLGGLIRITATHGSGCL